MQFESLQSAMHSNNVSSQLSLQPVAAAAAIAEFISNLILYLKDGFDKSK